MIKWIINKVYKNNPECICGYKMKLTKTREEYSWKCLWDKKCGWEVYESPNGKLHWYKKN